MNLTREQLRRYSRQIILPEIGLAGQQRLMASSALVIGAGGLGSPVLLYLVSSGVGRVLIAEADVLEWSNLHRQVLYDSSGVGEKKSELAFERLSQLNPEVKLEVVGKFDSNNAERLIQSVDVVVDASDNLETRYLVNDTCVRLERAWVWGAAEGFTGMSAAFDHTCSLRQAFPDAAPRDDCDTIGVFPPLLGVIGGLMAGAALRGLLGLPFKIGELTLHDALEGVTRRVKLQGAVHADSTLVY